MIEHNLEGVSKHHIYAHYLINKHRAQHGGELITYSANGGKLIPHDGFENQHGSGFWSSLWNGIKSIGKMAWPVLKNVAGAVSSDITGTDLNQLLSGDGTTLSPQQIQASKLIQDVLKKPAGKIGDYISKNNKYLESKFGINGLEMLKKKLAAQGVSLPTAVNPSTPPAVQISTPAVSVPDVISSSGYDTGIQQASGLRRRQKPKF